MQGKKLLVLIDSAASGLLIKLMKCGALFGVGLFAFVLGAGTSESRAGLTSGGADTQILSKIYLENKKRVLDGIKNINELKAQSDTMFKTLEEAQKLKKEFEFWARFNPDAEVRQLLGRLDSLTNLDEFEDADSFNARWNLIHAEIKRRFEKSNGPLAENSKASNKCNAVEGHKTSQQRIECILYEIEKSQNTRKRIGRESLTLGDPNLTDKDVQARIANANMILAQQALRENEERLLKAMQQQMEAVRVASEEEASINYINERGQRWRERFK